MPAGVINDSDLSTYCALSAFRDRGGSCGTERLRDFLSEAQPGGRSGPWALPAKPSRLYSPQDYGSALRGLCEGTLEGLLFLLLFSLLSAGALATVLCSLPRAWALFHRSGGEGLKSGEGDGEHHRGHCWGPCLHGSPFLLSATPLLHPSDDYEDTDDDDPFQPQVPDPLV